MQPHSSKILAVSLTLFFLRTLHPDQHTPMAHSPQLPPPPLPQPASSLPLNRPSPLQSILSPAAWMILLKHNTWFSISFRVKVRIFIGLSVSSVPSGSMLPLRLHLLPFSFLPFSSLQPHWPLGFLEHTRHIFAPGNLYSWYLLPRVLCPK